MPPTYRPRIAIMGLLLLATATAHAQQPVWDHPLQKTTIRDFHRTVNKLKVNNAIVRAFVQKKKMPDLSRSLISRGTMVVSQRGICMKTTSPVQSAIKITHTGIWQKTGTQKATYEKQSAGFNRYFVQLMTALFSGDKDALMDMFDVYYLPRNNGWVIGLTPQKRMMKRGVRSITLKGDAELTDIVFEQPGGDTTHITISTPTTASTLSLSNCVR